jgi:hypothetical protein
MTERTIINNIMITRSQGRVMSFRFLNKKGGNPVGAIPIIHYQFLFIGTHQR